ncbi:MAG TPA: 5-dehydro-2-deoxygluconokinase [Vicinamibacteria bacterium]|nr:5-dehydro-2-deoxygluconokinase [Vicinamibacteria bacterium]
MSVDDPLDVCVLGRVGYDLYAVEQGRPLAEVEHFSRHLGGSSANIAVGLARLGVRVAIVSSVGDDALADYLIGFLNKEGVDAARVTRVAGFGTSLCLTEVSPPERFPQVFYRYKPADSQVQAGEAELALVRRARMFVTNGTSLCASPSRESTARALETARGARVRTVFDIDYRPSSWASPEEAGRAARAVLPWVDVVIGNEDEVALLTEKREGRQQVRVVLDAGPTLLVRKRGAEGVEAFTRDTSASSPPIAVPVASTIGAGDGFASGFLAALLEARPLEDCLRRGNAAAAVVVSRVSCSDAMPYPAEVEAMLARA